MHTLTIKSLFYFFLNLNRYTPFHILGRIHIAIRDKLFDFCTCKKR
ncbi:protein of unknown function [Rhodovastum atsumiense]|nr:protein of unknown function [Rhodovastum atsumiense]